MMQYANISDDVAEPIGDALTGDQLVAYNEQLAILKERQSREQYELRLHHCHERLQLLHRFDAGDALIAKFWRRHIERITRRFQLHRAERTNSTVNL